MNLEKKRRVAVTGLGLITPLGNSVDATWTGLMAAKSGGGTITKFDAREFPVRFACEVKNFDRLTYVAKKEALTMGASTQYAISASHEARHNSGLSISDRT